jgi:hypothetical protein
MQKEKMTDKTFVIEDNNNIGNSIDWRSLSILLLFKFQRQLPTPSCKLPTDSVHISIDGGLRAATEINSL